MKITQEQKEQLIKMAQAARKMSYSPYSKFPVGAAILCDDGKIYSGTNVENASYGLTVCAERNAIFTSVGEGAKHVVALAVYAGREGDTDLNGPCGACLQVIKEFADIDMPLILIRKNKEGKIESVEKTLRDFYPLPFSKENL
ncbi:cytidine deaminase [Elusimicrobium posterum]|uniref:cytidine deaminase n=1 Tax=Elusimicrobium posterum TaxID=3116653 RepID=UPI003C75E1E6